MLVRSNRQPLHSGNTAPEVGPGAYSIREFSNPKERFGQAPFGSTAAKLHDYNSETPGPGSYNDSKAIISTGKTSVDKHNAAGVSFASRASRFELSGSQVPGPGTYDSRLPERHIKNANVMHTTSSRDGFGGLNSNNKYNNNSNKHHQSSPTSPNQQHVNWVKVATAPSIPAGPQAFGYEEGPGGALVQQPPPLSQGMGHEGTSRDVAGPGEYNPRFNLVQKTPHVPSFGVSQGRRSDAVANDSMHKPGPGSYNVDPHVSKSGVNLRLASASACFNSRTERIVVPGGDQPGPGQYYSDALARSSFKDINHYLATHPESFSAFGSSENDARRRNINDVPGPGAYQGGALDAPAVQIKNRSMKNAVFASTAERFRDKLEAKPGPGSYESADFGSLRQKLSKIHPGRFGGFGSTASRFVKTQQANETTSEQEPDQQQQQQQFPTSSSRTTRGNGAVSAFKPPSTVSRTKSPTMMKKEEQPLTWTDTRVLPDMWNRRSYSCRPSLLTSGPRLLSNSSEVPGPGSYKTNTDELKKGGVKFGGDVRFHHEGSGGRAASIGSRRNGGRGSDVPGPGSYFEPRSWNKQSFNVTFT